MITITKIFRFEAAHALYQYQGPCANVHGHSYELHVGVTTAHNEADYIKGSGVIFDFKDLKALVQDAILRHLDHKLILSKAYLAAHPTIDQRDNVYVLEAEPSVENLLLFCKKEITKMLPVPVQLVSLKLAETRDSYSDWQG